MGKAKRKRSDKRTAHPVARAVTAIVIIVCAAAILAQAGVLGSKGVAADDVTRVLIVAASPDEDGAVVGQIVLVADIRDTPASLEPVSPALDVEIPGTTYSTLADAYSFGGGEGVARALAQARGEAAHPYVALSADELAEAVAAAGGMRLTLPADMSVFDGTDLYTFERGPQTLSAARLAAVLKGAPYLADAERERLDASLAEGLAAVLAAEPGALEGATRTDLAPDALKRVAASL